MTGNTSVFAGDALALREAMGSETVDEEHGVGAEHEKEMNMPRRPPATDSCPPVVSPCRSTLLSQDIVQPFLQFPPSSQCALQTHSAKLAWVGSYMAALHRNAQIFISDLVLLLQQQYNSSTVDQDGIQYKPTYAAISIPERFGSVIVYCDSSTKGSKVPNGLIAS